MADENPVPHVVVEPATPESYATFWDAVPVDPPSAAADPPAPPAVAQDDAYAAFLNVSEDGPTVTLHVERY
jgi:hypothetical protein